MPSKKYADKFPLAGGKLSPTEEVSVVPYMVKAEDWKKATESGK